MRQAMIDAAVDARLREPLLEALQGVADWMRNRPDGGAG